MVLVVVEGGGADGCMVWEETAWRGRFLVPTGTYVRVVVLVGGGGLGWYAYENVSEG